MRVTTGQDEFDEMLGGCMIAAVIMGLIAGVAWFLSHNVAVATVGGGIGLAACLFIAPLRAALLRGLLVLLLMAVVIGGAVVALRLFNS